MGTYAALGLPVSAAIPFAYQVLTILGLQFAFLISGTVVLDCVVNPDGRVLTCEVARSLDAQFGLDQEAIKAARQWLFVPGKRNGVAVPVLVTIELTFTLRAKRVAEALEAGDRGRVLPRPAGIA